MSHLNGNKSFLYQFVYKNHWIDGALLGTYHASELYFVWGNQVSNGAQLLSLSLSLSLISLLSLFLSYFSPFAPQFPAIPGHLFNSKDRKMAATFANYWGNFAHTHDPSNATRPWMTAEVREKKRGGDIDSNVYLHLYPSCLYLAFSL